MTMPFVHLHCHSHYSLLDGTASISGLVRHAKELGMSALALTDHGNLFGAMEFYRTAKSAGVKPIIGYEAYVAEQSRFDRTEDSKRNNHLTLLAMNRTGYRNLLKLASIAFLKGFYYKPRIDKELLQKHHEGLICLSGGASGELARLLLSNNENDLEKARKIAIWYRNLFGDRYYLELQNHGLDAEKIVLSGLVDIATNLGIPAVATNDVHYIRESDWEAHDILLCTNTGKMRSERNRMQMDSDQFYFRNGDEMLAALPGQEEAIRRTLEIADRIDLDLESGKRHWPVVASPDGKNSDDYLRELCLEGLKRRYADNSKYYNNEKLADDVLDRLNSELSIIEKLDAVDYFLFVADLIRFSDERNIYRTARSSGAGSLVCYALNVSHACPLEYDLLFERFLGANPPDIDIDFEQDRRDEIVEHVKTRYGEDCVASVATFSVLAAKQAIKDVGRVLDMPVSFVEDIVKLIPYRWKIRIKDALEESEELQNRYDTEPDVRELIDYAVQLEGINRSGGVHACGYAIADKPLAEYVPLQKMQGETIVTQWQRADLEQAGVLVMDFLSLRSLSILARAIELIKETKGETLDPYEFPLDDATTFDLLSQGKTSGVFQLECEGMRELLQRLKPDRFRDIIAILALYRPGPLEGGMVDRYVDVKHGRKRASYPHPAMKEILSETNGVIVYQEQVMRILNKIGNIPLDRTYNLIKAICKKQENIIVETRKRFIEGAIENGASESQARDIFDLIVTFAGYGFNKSHATVYAQISYISAYLKANYPPEFMAALLCGDISKRTFMEKDSTVEYVEESRRMGIEIIPPAINLSGREYFIKDGKIVFALSAIKSCDDIAASEIVRQREADGSFASFDDFCRRVGDEACPYTTIENLVKSGAFDSFGIARPQLIRHLPTLRKAADDRFRGQDHLFSMFDDDELENEQKRQDLSGSPGWTPEETVQFEKEVLGLSLSDLAKTPSGC